MIETVDFGEIAQRNRDAVAALRDGFSAVADLGGMLGQTGEFDVSLPAAGQSLGELLDIKNIFDQTLVEPVAGLLGDFLQDAAQRPSSHAAAASRRCWKIWHR